MKKGRGQATDWGLCFVSPSVLWYCWLRDSPEDIRPASNLCPLITKCSVLEQVEEENWWESAKRCLPRSSKNIDRLARQKELSRLRQTCIRVALTYTQLQQTSVRFLDWLEIYNRLVFCQSYCHYHYKKTVYIQRHGVITRWFGAVVKVCLQVRMSATDECSHTWVGRTSASWSLVDRR